LRDGCRKRCSYNILSLLREQRKTQTRQAGYIVGTSDGNTGFRCGVDRRDNDGAPGEGKPYGLLDYAVFVAGRGEWYFAARNAINDSPALSVGLFVTLLRIWRIGRDDFGRSGTNFADRH